MRKFKHLIISYEEKMNIAEEIKFVYQALQKSNFSFNGKEEIAQMFVFDNGKIHVDSDTFSFKKKEGDNEFFNNIVAQFTIYISKGAQNEQSI